MNILFWKKKPQLKYMELRIQFENNLMTLQATDFEGEQDLKSAVSWFEVKKHDTITVTSGNDKTVMKWESIQWMELRECIGG